MSPRAVALESIRACLAGVIPSPLATCAADGTPNISYMSIVKYVDPERVALSRQFLNKTRANLDANPVAQVLVVDPGTCEAYLLDLRHVHTETDGPVFEAMRTELEAIASQTGMGDVFRLRGADIYHVVRCEAVHDDAAPAPARPERDLIGPLDELTRRLALADSYADAATAALRSLEDLFDFPHAILLAADERGDRLFAVASNGYSRSGAGAEVAVGVGLIGIAAERRHVVSVANLGRSRTMSAAVRDSVERGGEELAEKEIPLPGLGRAQSASAVPLVVRGRLTGLLYLESEQIGCFGPHNERLLRIVGAHLGAALSALEDDSPETAVAVSRPHAAGAAAAPDVARACCFRRLSRRVLPGRRQRVRRRRVRRARRAWPDPLAAAQRPRRRRPHGVHQPRAAPRRAPRPARRRRQPRGAAARPAPAARRRGLRRRPRAGRARAPRAARRAAARALRDRHERADARGPRSTRRNRVATFSAPIRRS